MADPYQVRTASSVRKLLFDERAQSLKAELNSCLSVIDSVLDTCSWKDGNSEP